MTPLLLALTLAAPVPKDFKKTTTDLQVMQGEWEELERSNYGNKQPVRGTRYLLNDNQVKIHSGNGDPRVVKWTLDEKAKTYLWEAPWGTWIGRYKIDGDTVTRISVKQGKPLPEVIAPGKDVEYSVYRRVKK